MDVANNYTTCYRQLYRHVPVPFSIVQQFHPTCPCTCTFYTCSTLHLKKICENVLFIGLTSIYTDVHVLRMYMYIHV